ncbi:MAG TPA: hypothetical protein VEP90_24840 [Methylomirabilota bacterium]|nr:hypothetical protein [Methylomirabilota bacterium]
MWKLPWKRRAAATKKPTIRIGVEITEDLYRLLEAEARSKSITVPELIRKTIITYLVLRGQVGKGNKIIIVKDNKVLKKVNLP